MASAISGYISQIQNAVYGEQVRTAIVNALEACYSDVENPDLQSAAFLAAIEEAYDGGILDITEVTQVSQMTNDNIIYRYMGTETGYTANTLYYYNGSAWVPIGSGVRPAATAALMTDTSAIYKYPGSETGYKTNALYYYNGTAWVIVGTGVPCDDTLTLPGVPADAQAVGDVLAELGADYVQTFTIPSNAEGKDETGYKLDASGLAVSDANYILKKYYVEPNSTVYLKIAKDSDTVLSWQNTHYKPISTNVSQVQIKTAKSAQDGFVKVPDGATWLIVSALTSNTTNVLKYARVDDASSVSVIGNTILPPAVKTAIGNLLQSAAYSETVSSDDAAAIAAWMQSDYKPASNMTKWTDGIPYSGITIIDGSGYTAASGAIYEETGKSRTLALKCAGAKSITFPEWRGAGEANGNCWFVTSADARIQRVILSTTEETTIEVPENADGLLLSANTATLYYALGVGITPSSTEVTT